MQIFGLFVITGLISHFTTWVFLALKFGWITREGWPYNWENDTPHTLWFIVNFSINNLIWAVLFIFLAHWRYRLFLK